MKSPNVMRMNGNVMSFRTGRMKMLTSVRMIAAIAYERGPFAMIKSEKNFPRSMIETILTRNFPRIFSKKCIKGLLPNVLS